jgi:muramoyltetrapeptide carboxypeptidase LdcA involved in peptidoglycan recycling
LIRPRKLRPGDRVAAVTLSWGGPGHVPHRYEAGKRQFEEAFGVEVVETPHALRDPEWIRRNPAARADDLMQAFADSTIQGIVSTIGGDDSIRILPFLDPATIRDNPKVFLGYSDTTVTHWACFEAGLGTFYGPSFMSGFAENGGMFPYMVEAVRKSIFSSEPLGVLEPNPDGWTVEFLEWEDPATQSIRRTLNPTEPWRYLQGSGKADGRLFGGCLEVVEFLRGTRVWPAPEAWEGLILFLETSEEAPEPRVLERALRSYAAMGVLSRIRGLLLGRPGGAVPPEKFEEYDQAVLRVVRDEEGLADLPVVTRMDFGHTDPMLVLPFGVAARIDSARQRVEVLASGVTD